MTSTTALPGTASTSGIAIRDVTKSYDGTTVVDRVTLDLPSGGLTCLVGPNGAGKSTWSWTVGSSTSKPRSWIIRRRLGSSSMTTTSAPTCRAVVAMSTPMGPPPMTTAFSPGCRSARRTSWTDTATGSTSAAWSRRRDSGSRTSTWAGTFHRPCREPGESMPMKSRFWQMC